MHCSEGLRLNFSSIHNMKLLDEHGLQLIGTPKKGLIQTSDGYTFHVSLLKTANKSFEQEKMYILAEEIALFLVTHKLHKEDFTEIELHLGKLLIKYLNSREIATKNINLDGHLERTKKFCKENDLKCVFKIKQTCEKYIFNQSDLPKISSPRDHAWYLRSQRNPSTHIISPPSVRVC